MITDKKIVTNDTLLYFWQKIRAMFATKDVATQSAAGLMSAADKTKLDGMGGGDYVLPTASADTLGGIKVGSNLSISNGVLSADAQSYNNATTTDAGLMSAADKTKLDGVEAGAEKNVIDAISVNGTALVPSGNAVSITVPTNNNELTNGAGYQTAAQVAQAIADAATAEIEVVQSLPATGATNKIYFVAHAHGTGDAYDEYKWIPSTSSFEKIGNTDIDLTGYIQTSDLVEMTNAEVDAMMAYQPTQEG